MYRLLAVDMDGTLLNSEKRISNENICAIKSAVEKGVKVVITSGRGLKGVENFLEDMNLKGEGEYLIANNGGTIYRTDNFKCIIYNGLRGKDLKEAYKLSEKLGLQILAYTHEGGLSPEENEFTKFEREIAETPIKIVDFNSIDDNEEITKIMFSQSEEKLLEAINKIPEEFTNKYNLVKTMPTVLEMMDKHCNKGFSVKLLAEKLNIDSKDIICIGDESNDIEMIKYAGLGVAMGNAINEIKEASDYITDTNDNNGVAKAINKFIL